jgi:hypothetical protein
MTRYDLQFLILATLSLICGVILGIVMAGSHDFQLMPVHAHINLVGWASLALFGLTYRAYPMLARRKLARAHILLSGSGAILLPVGIAMAILAQIEALAIASSLLWLGGCLIFLVQLLSLVSESGTAPATAAAEDLAAAE